MGSATVAHRLFSLGIPVTEKILRTVLVYVTVLILLRLSRRTAAQLNTFDLVVLLLLSNVVQNAIIGPDNSLLGGLIGVAVLIGVNDVVVTVVRRNDHLDRALEGSETPLVRDGSFLDAGMRRLGIRRTDLEVALRRQGARHVEEVKEADLYPSGAIVVDLRPEARDASVTDLERVEAKLDGLIAAVGRLATGA